METDDRRGRLVRRWALLCAGLALAVVATSAFLRLHAPAGAVDPAAVAAARLLHRIVASAALLVALVLALAGAGAGRRERRLALALLATGVALALLGALLRGGGGAAGAGANVLGGLVMVALAAALALPSRPVVASGGAARFVLPVAWATAASGVVLGVGAPSGGALLLLLLHGAGAALVLAGMAAVVRRRAGGARWPVMAAIVVLAAEAALGAAMAMQGTSASLAWAHNLGAALLLAGAPWWLRAMRA